MDLLVGTVTLRPYVFAFLALFLLAGVGGSRLAAHPRVRRMRLAGGLARGVLLHAHRHPVRALPLHGLTRGRELFIAERAVHGFAVLHVPRLRGVLPRAGRRWPAAAASRRSTAVRGRRAHDGARRRHRSRWRCAATAGSSGRIFYLRRARRSYFGVPLSNFAGWVIVGAGRRRRLSGRSRRGALGTPDSGRESRYTTPCSCSISP